MEAGFSVLLTDSAIYVFGTFGDFILRKRT
jgi:hypothetical protein